MPNEFIVPRSHRNSYDHGVRAAGAVWSKWAFPTG